eukprot:5386905-Alexandrium_andersonii.AAC.1
MVGMPRASMDPVSGGSWGPSRQAPPDSNRAALPGSRRCRGARAHRALAGGSGPRRLVGRRGAVPVAAAPALRLSLIHI